LSVFGISNFPSLFAGFETLSAAARYRRQTRRSDSAKKSKSTDDNEQNVVREHGEFLGSSAVPDRRKSSPPGTVYPSILPERHGNCEHRGTSAAAG
jgi:hypothetical protein